MAYRDLTKKRKKAREQMRKWRKENPEENRRRSKIYNERYYKKHPERKIKKREYDNERSKKYYQEHREWKRFQNRRYKARKRHGVGSHTFGDWELLKKQYGYCCPWCKRCEPEIKLEEDHIIPLTKGGSDYIENIQPLCRNCNSKKYNKIIREGITL